MKRFGMVLLLVGLLVPALALAHFMVLQPSRNLVLDRAESNVKIDLRFGHPFAQGLMDMAPTTQFGVMVDGKKVDLKSSLQLVKQGDFRTWTTTYQLKQPGDHIFYVEPAPYWEPGEGKFIVHYTKTIVHAYGLEEGWDEMVGFKIEIQPLTRPYGLWTGNVFTGQVMCFGKPLPYAEIEVAYDNAGVAVKKEAEAFHIQTLKADANGVFTYAMPRAGWWGFAALSEDKKKMANPDGELMPVEIGGLIWVHTVDME